MQDSSGNNDGYTSLILKKTSSLFGLIGYFLGNQEYDKPEENTKRKDKKKLAKENAQIYGMLKSGISMMATKISSLNRGFGFLNSLSDLILSEDVIISTGMGRGDQLSIENQENIDLIMDNLHQINQTQAQSMLHQFADSFQGNAGVLAGQNYLVNTLELEQKFDCLIKSSNHEISTSEPGSLHAILLPEEIDTIASVLTSHTIEPIELMQKVIESNLLLDEMLVERNSQKISPYELIPQESYYNDEDICLKKGKRKSLRRRTLTGEGKNEPSFLMNDKNIGCEKYIPDHNQLPPANKTIEKICLQTEKEIDSHENSDLLQPCDSENFNAASSIQHNSIDFKASNPNTSNTKSNTESEIIYEVATPQNLSLKTKDSNSAELHNRDVNPQPTKLPSITCTTAELEETSLEYKIGSKVLQLISNSPMNDQYSFEPTVLHIEKVNSCTDESSSSDKDNSLQIENFINLDDEFSLKFSKMTTDNKFNFFVWS